MPVTHSSAQQARQVIADRLRDLRADAGLTGHEHALRCGWSAAKTSRVERNKTAPSADDIHTWCRVCAADDQADDLIASLRAVEGMWVEWQRIERDGLRHAQDAIRPLYEQTMRFRAYSSWVVPGMIQTRDYTEQVLRAVQRWRSLPDDVDQALESRVERQRLLAGTDKVFAFVLEEAVLRATVVDAAAMAGQLRYFMDVASLPNVSLGIVPASAGRGHWPVEDFWLYDDTQVNVELVSGYLTVTQPREVQQYAQTFARLASIAVFGAEARRLITAAIEAL